MNGGDRFRGVFYSNWVLLGCVILHAIGSGEYFYGYSVFYTLILIEYDWSKGMASLDPWRIF